MNPKTDYILVTFDHLTVERINEVALRRARFVLRWVTVSWFNFRCGTLSWYVTSHPGQLSQAIPSWVGAVSTSQSAMTSCGAGRYGSCVGGRWVKLCDPIVTHEHFRDEGLIIKRYISSSVYFTFYFLTFDRKRYFSIYTEVFGLNIPCVRDIDSPRSKHCEGEFIYLGQGCRVDHRYTQRTP